MTLMSSFLSDAALTLNLLQFSTLVAISFPERFQSLELRVHPPPSTGTARMETSRAPGCHTRASVSLSSISRIRRGGGLCVGSAPPTGTTSPTRWPHLWGCLYPAEGQSLTSKRIFFGGGRGPFSGWIFLQFPQMLAVPRTELTHSSQYTNM